MMEFELSQGMSKITVAFNAHGRTDHQWLQYVDFPSDRAGFVAPCRCRLSDMFFSSEIPVGTARGGGDSMLGILEKLVGDKEAAERLNRKGAVVMVSKFTGTVPHTIGVINIPDDVKNCMKGNITGPAIEEGERIGVFLNGVARNPMVDLSLIGPL